MPTPGHGIDRKQQPEGESCGDSCPTSLTVWVGHIYVTVPQADTFSSEPAARPLQVFAHVRVPLWMWYGCSKRGWRVGMEWNEERMQAGRAAVQGLRERGERVTVGRVTKEMQRSTRG